jgi:MSHA biogenesis protein MshJ
MNARWQAFSARYAALNRREQTMVAMAVVLAAGMGGFTAWVDSPKTRAATLEKQIVQQQLEATALRTQVAELKARITDPDAARKAALVDARAQLAALDRDRKTYNSILVPPQRVPQLLQSLLARHRGLELIDMRTLEPASLLARRPARAEGAMDAAGPPASAAQPKNGGIFRHGIEIRVAGGYADLLAYVAELERSPQKLLWEKMSLVVKEYPRSELTLTVYTLSLDSTWLVV